MATVISRTRGELEVVQAGVTNPPVQRSAEPRAMLFWRAASCGTVRTMENLTGSPRLVPLFSCLAASVANGPRKGLSPPNIAIHIT